MGLFENQGGAKKKSLSEFGVVFPFFWQTQNVFKCLFLIL